MIPTTNDEHTKKNAKPLLVAIFLVSLFATVSGSKTGAIGQTAAEPSGPILLAAILLPFLIAAAIPFVYRFLGEKLAYLSALGAATSFLLVLSQYGVQGSVTYEWIPSLNIALQLYVDGLSLLIGMLASGVGILIFIYSKGYMHGESSLVKYYASLLMFMGSMLGVVFAADLITLFVFWEMTSISSFMLIGHYQKDSSSLYGARKSMLITIGASLPMMVGFLFIYSVTGTFSLAELLSHPEAVQQSLRSAGLFIPVLILVALGAAAKSAQVPLHIWLPNAMEAPTPVSAFLHSATMVKAGVYLIGRFRPILIGEEWMILFVTLGLVTMTVTGILAVAAEDIKELLAYSTASHLGLITAGFGFVSGLGGETGAFHILNHALFKAPLFLVAGIIAHATGTRAIDKIGGLRHEMPIVAGVAVVAGLGMAAFPPFNGFYSKELLYESAYEAAMNAGGVYWILPALAVFGSIFTVLYSLRFIALFFGEKPAELGDLHRPSWQMLLPPILLAGIALLVGLVPQFAVDSIIQSVYESVSAGHAHTMHVGLPTHLSPALFMSLITMGMGIGLYRYYTAIHEGIQTFFLAFPVFKANWWYDTTLTVFESLGTATVHTVHTGLLRTYITWILGTISLLALAGFLATGAVLPILTVDLALPIILVLGVALIGAFAVTVAPSHISGVLTLSILGFMVAIYYILANAPDLALTQLVVETLALVIFLLVLDKVPEFYNDASWGRVMRDAVLASLVGVTVAFTVLVSTAGNPDTIAHYFVEHAVPDGGGGNIVNVILVDFRGFDTLGEISVIAMAALAVITLIAMRGYGQSHLRDRKDHEHSSEERLKGGVGR